MFQIIKYLSLYLVCTLILINCFILKKYKWEVLFHIFLCKYIQKFLRLHDVSEVYEVWSENVSDTDMSYSLRPHESPGPHNSPGSCPWNSPGKNTGVGCHSHLQGIFPTQGSNPGLLLCRWVLYCLSHQRSHYRSIPVTKFHLNTFKSCSLIS